MDEILKTFELTQTDAVMIVVWALIFLVITKLLNKFFFAPYLALLEAREAATKGASDSAREITAEAERLNKEYEQSIFEERVKVMNVRNESLSAARAQSTQIIEKAEKEAQASTSTFRHELNQKIALLSQRSPQEAANLAEELVRRVGV